MKLNKRHNAYTIDKEYVLDKTTRFLNFIRKKKVEKRFNESFYNNGRLRFFPDTNFYNKNNSAQIAIVDDDTVELICDITIDANGYHFSHSEFKSIKSFGNAMHLLDEIVNNYFNKEKEIL